MATSQHAAHQSEHIEATCPEPQAQNHLCIITKVHANQNKNCSWNVLYFNSSQSFGEALSNVLYPTHLLRSFLQNVGYY